MTTMELRLIVMRHGEAETVIGEGDRYRHLTARGRKQAERVGKLLQTEGWIPNEALISTATRTRETYELAAAAFPEAPAARFLDSFYLADCDGVFSDIALCVAQTVLIVGHNPGWSELVERLAGKRVALMPSETALLSIKASSWEEAVQMSGGWECKRLLIG